MIKVLFVCHGNICRSPMAEFLFKKYVKEKKKEEYFIIDSKATSKEEIGNGVHYGTKKILNRLHIDCSLKQAEQLKKQDYDFYDYILGMDAYNLRNINKIFEGRMEKVHLLLDFTPYPRDISDPWYTGDFEQTYKDIMEGIEGFYRELSMKKLV
ncbi:MAG: low molecular weight phosphotyrosine protein phosphatase [Anaeroplasmataceae bacterium]|nr:low molecular weight phosphotyrosine protein phosphatase [Anaeroplasmataceae bacterium]